MNSTPSAHPALNANVKERKIAVFGSRSVGKSCLAYRFVSDNFNDGFSEEYYPTIENTFSKNIEHRGANYSVEIMDTAGLDEYSRINSKLFIVHGYMLVYSVIEYKSFERLRTIRESIINELGTENFPLILVGNKTDLAQDLREVTPEQGKELAAEFKCAWQESSAKENLNVFEAFTALLDEIDGPVVEAKPSKCIVM